MQEQLIWLVLGAGALYVLWDIGKRVTTGKKSNELEELEKRVIARCDKNTAATENLAKNFAEWRQNIEHKMVAFGINRPPKGPHAS